MAALISTQLSAGFPNFAHGPAGNIKNVLATVNVPIGTAAGDTAALFDLPAGARVLNVTLTNPTIVGAALTLNVGDAGLANRYFALTGLNSASVASSATVTGIGYLNPSITRVVGVFAGITSTIATQILVNMQFEIEGVPS